MARNTPCLVAIGNSGQDYFAKNRSRGGRGYKEGGPVQIPNPRPIHPILFLDPMPIRHAKWTKRARWNRRQFELSKHPSHPSRLQILWSKMWSKGTLDRKGRISESAREFLTCMEQHRANSRAMRLGNPPPYPELVESLPPNKEEKLVAPLPPNQYIDGTSHQIADSITRPCPDQTALVVYKVPKEKGKSALVMYHHDQLTAGNADDYEIDDFTRPDDEFVFMEDGDEPVAPPLPASEVPPSDVPQVGDQEPLMARDGNSKDTAYIV